MTEPKICKCGCGKPVPYGGIFGLKRLYANDDCPRKYDTKAANARKKASRKEGKELTGIKERPMPPQDRPAPRCALCPFLAGSNGCGHPRRWANRCADLTAPEIKAAGYCAWGRK